MPFSGKRAVRRGVKMVKRAVKRRYAPKGKINYGRIATDAAKLVRLMNVEKKYVDVSQTNRQFAQNSYNTVEVSPAIPQGITGSTRNGNSVKLVSARMNIQIKTQANVVNAFKYRYYLVCKSDHQGATTTSVTTQFLDNNIFSGVIDYHSLRDPEFFKNYKVITSGQGTILPESLAGQTGITQFHKNLKLSHHFKYDDNASVTSTINGMYLIMTGDSGDQTTGTGAIYDVGFRWWYVDN